MSKHTPGPWYHHEAEQFGDTRFYIAQQEGAPYTPNYSDVASLIAETVSGELVSVQRANAQLIAAAPDLLEACQLMLTAMKLANWEGDFAALKGIAAIAKAIGEQP